MRAVLVLPCLLLGGVCLAQQSASYKMTEHVFNAGGHPVNGVVLISSNYHVRLDAIGDALAGTALTAPGFHVDGGFVSTYLPPGEVLGPSFLDTTTLSWLPEKSIGVYSLYRGLLTALASREYGECEQHDLTTETAIEPDTPPAQDGWFYLVTAKNRLREEGTKGQDSAGAERPNPHPCP